MSSNEEKPSSDNPFEVSGVLGDKASDQKPYVSPYHFDLEGNLIVCGSHLILPPICVYTGVTEDLVEIQRRTVFPSMKLVIKERSCYVITYVARSEHSRRKRISTLFRVIVTTGFMMMLAAWWLQRKQTAILFPLGLVIAGVSIFLLYRFNLPLVLVRYKAPGIYWVRGFSKAFLAQLAMYKLNVIGRRLARVENWATRE